MAPLCICMLMVCCTAWQRCRESLQRLVLAYHDLYLIHWPFTGNKGPTLKPPLKAGAAAAAATAANAASCSRCRLPGSFRCPYGRACCTCTRMHVALVLQDTWGAMEQLVRKGLVR